MQGRPGDAVVLGFEDAGDARVEMQIKREKPKGKIFTMGALPPVRVWFESRILDGEIGYLTFNTFMDPGRIMGEFKAAMESFADCKGVIIDLRGNPGGIGFMASGMSGFVISEKKKSLGVMLSRESQIEFRIHPRPEVFAGPVALLIDGASASTSEIFAGGLQDVHRARIFGSTSAGAALPSHVEELPNGDRYQFAVADFLLPSGNRIEGVGVLPDQPVSHDRKALIEGRDAVIEAASAWIRSPEE